MPNTKQAEKRMRQNEARRDSNKNARSRMRSAVKKVLKAGSPDEAKAGLSEAMKRVDKAAKKGVIHRNAADRKKRQLTRAATPK